MIIKINTYEKLSKAYDIFVELRPHLVDKDSFVTQVFDQQKEGYNIISIEVKDKIVSYVGFRFITTLA